MNPNTKAFTNREYVGKRVRVTGPGHYHGRCVGEAGTIRAVWSADNMAVELDFAVNKNSTHGYFYFKFSELEILDNENTKTATAAETGESKMQKMNNYLNVAVIQFLNASTAFKTYEYANYVPDLKANDLVVVMSAHHGMGLAEVVEIKEHTDAELYREIVAKVDTSAYDSRVATRKQAAELKAKMQERAKQLQDIALYQMLAENDPEMAQLLQDYKSLNN